MANTGGMEKGRNIGKGLLLRDMAGGGGTLLCRGPTTRKIRPKFFEWTLHNKTKY